MAHGSSPRHARKPKKASAKKPARSAASRDEKPDDRPPRGRYSKTMPERDSATPARKTAPGRGRKSGASGGRSTKPSDSGAQRLQKLLAAAGFGSRRDVEQFLIEERVTVNGRVASLGDKADPLVDEIRVDGERLAREKPAYWIVNKPRGVITTVRDTEGRRTVMDLLPPKVGRLFPVGRLDLETSGLLLMTNDGDLAHALLHPSLGNEREYRVNVKGQLDAKAIGRLERGVSLDEGKTARAQVEDVRFDPDSQTTSLSLTLVEGKKRQIRRSLLVLGFPVRRLVRVRMGPLRIGRLPVGESRALRPEERRALLEHVRRLRAGEPVAAAARSGSGRDDLAAPPRKSGARRPAKKKAGARRAPPSGPRAAKSDGRRSAPSGPKAMTSAARKSPPSGPRAQTARKSPPSGPRAQTARAQTERGGRAGPAGPRKKAARKKSAAARPSARRAPKKGARKKAARKKSAGSRRPAKGAARKRPGTKPRGRPGPRR